MKIKANKHLYIVVLVFIFSVGFYIWLINSPYFAILDSWAKQNLITFSVSLLALKIFSIVYPPLPGGLVTLASIPFLGWQLAYGIDFLGSMIGSSIAYFIAKKYGYDFLNKIFDAKTINKIHRVKVHPNREIESVFALRILLGTTVLEVLCYGAGLLNIKYKNFLIGSIGSHLLLGIPTYYLASNIVEFKNIPLTVGLIVLGAFIFWKLRKRYFKID